MVKPIFFITAKSNYHARKKSFITRAIQDQKKGCCGVLPACFFYH